jgi:hypothetical protein
MDTGLDEIGAVCGQIFQQIDIDPLKYSIEENPHGKV